MKFKVTAKVNEKWRTFGNGKTNDKGTISIGIANNDEFKKLVNSDAKWLNFYLFEDEEGKKKEVAPETEAMLAQLKGEAADSEIPF